jgi:sugar O-acyltransferase (sialic acid O-acetyltransferase NeuD family)
MKKTPVVLVGASEQGKVVADILEKQNTWEILGFLDDNKPLGASVAGYHVIGKDPIIAELLQKHPDLHLFVSIGDNWIRYKVYERLKRMHGEIPFATAIHPSAVIGNRVTIGEGTCIMAGAIINPDTTIGVGCIINTAATIDHDNLMGEFSSIAPGAHTGGQVQVGSFTCLSIGVHVIHGVHIGGQVLVGAGAAVVSHIPNQEVWFGVPAKHIRKREIGERYL